ncbi:MAG TPA: MerC domain-containing protein [Drouetiella sp.]
MTIDFKSHLKTASEFLAIAAPIICLFDCVVLPVFAIFAPFLGHHVIHGVGDQVLTVLVLALCLPFIIPGVRKHGNKRVLYMFSAGACLMLFTNCFGERLDSVLHIGLSALTSALLLRANWLNKKLLACSCSHHHHAHK